MKSRSGIEHRYCQSIFYLQQHKNSKQASVVETTPAGRNKIMPRTTLSGTQTRCPAQCWQIHNTLITISPATIPTQTSSNTRSGASVNLSACFSLTNQCCTSCLVKLTDCFGCGLVWGVVDAKLAAASTSCLSTCCGTCLAGSWSRLRNNKWPSWDHHNTRWAQLRRYHYFSWRRAPSYFFPSVMVSIACSYLINR